MTTSNLILGDCLVKMKDIPDASVDTIITDPPYNISKENDNRDRSKSFSPVMRRESPLKYDFGTWDNRGRKEFISFTRLWFKECCRILKDGGWFISFFNKEDISFLGWEGKKNNVRTRTIYTWIKSNPVPSFRKVNYLSASEFVWIGSKGELGWTFNFKMQKEMSNYMQTANSSSYGETEHPTEKPEKLIRHFVQVHTNVGDTILDPFMGSGTVGVACHKFERNFIGIEKSEEYFKIAEARVNGARKQTKLTFATTTDLSGCETTSTKQAVDNINRGVLDG